MLNAIIMGIGAILALVGAGFLFYRIYNEDKFKVWTAALIVVGLLTVVLGDGFKVVPTGYTGVRTTFGMIDQESVMPGFNGKAPFVQQITLVNNKQQDVSFEDRVWSETVEQTVVYMEDVTVSYRIVPESSAWIFANVEDWVENLVNANIVSSALKAASRTLEANVVTDRGTIEPLAKESLQAAVNAKYGEGSVEILNVIIGNMDFEDSYNAAIARKSEAMQEAEEQAIRNQTNIDKALAEAEAARAAAQGQADAERIIAEGKAAANEILTGSITEATQRQDALGKWDGKLPLYVAGSDGSGPFGVLDVTDME